jgi:benzodiazapine receptor
MLWKSLIIPAVTIGVALLGSSLTSSGMDWYRGINLPSWTPPGSVIGTVWTVIFILATISAILVRSYPGAKYAKRIPLIMAAFVLNAMLNVGWSWLFFSLHLIGWAAWEAILLEANVIALIVLIRPISRVAAGLLAPYAAWVAFATVLTFIIWQLN